MSNFIHVLISILIVAECNVNLLTTFTLFSLVNILIVAECNVNLKTEKVVKVFEVF